MFFQIHEDKENVQLNAYHRAEFRETKNIPNKLTNIVGFENRKVLGHVTNTRHTNKNLTRYPLAPKNVIETKFDQSQRSLAVKRKAADNLLDEACLLVQNSITDVTVPSPGDSLYSENDDVLDMSIVIDSPVEERTLSYRDLELDEAIYAEPIYRKFIFDYLRKVEHLHRPHPLYMTKQTELNNDMRSILIDWLVSISDEYEFAPDTLHLAVSYIDRFLSKMSVVRTKFQLLGVTAMMIAAKYEEIHPPDIFEFSSLTKETCSVKQILKMEQLILRALSFDLTTPTVQTFIEEYAIQGNVSRKSINLAMFISELCLVDDVHYINYLPSEVAASALALSQHTLEEEVWPKRFENICGYNLTTLYPLVKKQYRVFEESPNKSLQAVRLKYGKDTFRNVSSYTPRKLI